MEHEQMTEVVQTHRTLHAIDENKKTNANNKNKKKHKKKAKKKKHKTQPNTNPIAVDDDTLCVTRTPLQAIHQNAQKAMDQTTSTDNILCVSPNMSPASKNNILRDGNMIMYMDPHSTTLHLTLPQNTVIPRQITVSQATSELFDSTSKCNGDVFQKSEANQRRILTHLKSTKVAP
eukprot:276373_1